MTQYSSFSALTNPMEFAYPEADAQAWTRKIQIRCLNARAVAEITLFDHFHYTIACLLYTKSVKDHILHTEHLLHNYIAV
jgi:hypothetical protein